MRSRQTTQSVSGHELTCHLRTKSLTSDDGSQSTTFRTTTCPDLPRWFLTQSQGGRTIYEVLEYVP